MKLEENVCMGKYKQLLSYAEGDGQKQTLSLSLQEALALRYTGLEVSVCANVSFQE